MDPIDIVVAGTGFETIRDFMAEVLPEARSQMIEPALLRRDGVRASVLVPTMSRIDGALMDRIEGLRLIQQWGAGLEGVDLAAATERGIAVANVPTGKSGNADSVAEWCVMSAIALSRRLPVAQRGIRQGAAWGAPMGRALVGRTATIVGLGGIGQALARRLKPFGMRLVGIKQRPDPALTETLGLEWLGGPDDLDAVLPGTDYLFLCLPLTDGTRHLVNERTLDLLPADACIINPGRGALVSEKALLSALSAGRLTGAALDVFETEPLPADSPLLDWDRLLATPHIGGVTDLCYQGTGEVFAENVRRVVAGQLPLNCVNAEALG